MKRRREGVVDALDARMGGWSRDRGRRMNDWIEIGMHKNRGRCMIGWVDGRREGREGGVDLWIN